jgi:serine protease Do
MKKILLLVTIFTGVILTGCIPTTEEVKEDKYIESSLTREQIIALIEELTPEAEVNTIVDISDFQDQLTSIVGEARNGVLGILNTSDFGQSSGSGVIYKKEANLYYLVTNHHVVDGANFLTIVYEKDGLLYEISNEYVELLGSDPVTDLAVLTFNSLEDFTVIPLADSYEIELGEIAIAIGNPLGLEYYGTVTMGIISGLARYVQDEEFNATLLQHDAAISPGNSGGALLNINGELIGINNLKIVDQDVSNIGFAIPSNTVKRITADLEDDGIVTRPYLGILTIAQINVCNDGPGVCVSVQVDGAAYDAGLVDGDTIIGYKTIEMDNFIEINNFNDLKEAILNSKVGDTIVIKYIREGVEYTSDEAELNTHPDDIG